MYGNVQISTQALREIFYREIPVAFFTTGGWFCGRAIGHEARNVELRRAQYARFEDEGTRLRLARGVVASKIKNCRTFLRRNAETVGDELRQFDAWAEHTRAAASLETLLGIEGAAAAGYFAVFDRMLKSDFGFLFEKRNRRPPEDPVNAMLSCAYALLVKDLTLAVETVGLDPLLGFYHRPRAGRPALALDLMEEFRPLVADSVVVAAVNTGAVPLDDFVRSAGACALSPRGRKKLIAAYERRMDQEIEHPVFGYRASYRRVLELQARLLAKFLTGEIEEYPSFNTR